MDATTGDERKFSEGDLVTMRFSYPGVVAEVKGGKARKFITEERWHCLISFNWLGKKVEIYYPEDFLIRARLHNDDFTTTDRP